MKDRRRTKKLQPTNALFQFKITLLGSKPPIWRRIQVVDCTLDELHAHIQAAMGWTNSHLHEFEINRNRYGAPDALDDGFGDSDTLDSTKTLLSEIIPAKAKKFRFRYEYDFGDGWLHDVLFEGCPEPAEGKKYPLCVKGARACPPEDVGGIYGYYNFLEAISNPKHADHEMYLEWSGPIDPAKFDPDEATKMMQAGLPNWRE